MSLSLSCHVTQIIWVCQLLTQFILTIDFLNVCFLAFDRIKLSLMVDYHRKREEWYTNSNLQSIHCVISNSRQIRFICRCNIVEFFANNVRILAYWKCVIYLVSICLSSSYFLTPISEKKRDEISKEKITFPHVFKTLILYCSANGLSWIENFAKFMINQDQRYCEVPIL